LESTGDAIQVRGRSLVVPGGSKGIFEIDTNDLWLPKLRLKYGPAAVDYIHFVDQGDLVMAIDEE